MKDSFPCYASSFLCVCTMQDATKRIYEAAACQHNNLKIIKAYDTSIHKIVISDSTGSYIYYNSFKPIVNIGLKDVDGKTQVSVLFELQKSIKVLMTLFSILALLFEITLLVLWIMNQLSTPVLLCLPLGLMILSYTLSAVGLYFSSKGVLRILFMALTYEDAKYMPPIHKPKGTVLLFPPGEQISKP